MNVLSKQLCLSGLLVVNVLSSAGATSSEMQEQKSYSLQVNASYPANLYWGDTHLHTNLSIDANSWGRNKNLGPEEAYRFAQGEKVTAHNGMQAQLKRPLDFIVVADHAEAMGVFHSLNTSDPHLKAIPAGKVLFERLHAKRVNDSSYDLGLDLDNELWSKDIEDPGYQYTQTVWDRVAKIADDNNQPGKFTTFIGFEWSSSGQRGKNLHRVVIFEGDAEKATQVTPITRNMTSDPEELWSYMADYQQKTDSDILAIPHNSNVSNGEMFSLQDFSGASISAGYAKTRSRWEPLLEVTQIKGDSEAYPLLSPDDEFADFETWNSWVETSFDLGADKVISEWNEEEKERKKSEYARSALKLGLQQQARLGVNPFKFGLIGSTDSHTALATADDNNYWGKFSSVEPSPNRLKMVYKPDWPVHIWGSAASGYAGIWAQENTRESLFAAMKRKEVYATTGPRIAVRFFGGWTYQREDAFNPELAKVGYEKGVPMGGDLTQAPNDKSPAFLIRAVKDPDGANLDRVQVIKGWHDANGELHEKIYDVALSDERKPNWRGKVKPVGSTVDIANASYSNRIGDPELAVVWEDPDFDKNELAFYYVRVLEIPTPRWTAYDAKFFGLKDLPEEIPMVTQERAYTSPIWYTPHE